VCWLSTWLWLPLHSSTAAAAASGWAVAGLIRLRQWCQCHYHDYRTECRPPTNIRSVAEQLRQLTCPSCRAATDRVLKNLFPSWQCSITTSCIVVVVVIVCIAVAPPCASPENATCNNVLPALSFIHWCNPVSHFITENDGTPSGHCRFPTTSQPVEKVPITFSPSNGITCNNSDS